MQAPISIAEISYTAFEAALRRREGSERWIRPPWKKFDMLVDGGMRPGLWVHASGTGTGKTQFAIELALHAAVQGAHVLWVDLENGTEVTGSRVVSYINNIPWGGFIRGKVPLSFNGEFEDTMDRVYMQTKDMRMNFIISKPSEFSVLTLDSYVRQMSKDARGEPCMLVIDYTQIAAASSGVESDMRLRVAQLTSELRSMANDGNVLIWAISSISREKWMTLINNMDPDTRGKVKLEPGRTPPEHMQGVGAESSGIEFSADSVLTSTPWRHDTLAGGKVLSIALAKQRDGETGWMKYRFDGLKFYEVGNAT